MAKKRLAKGPYDTHVSVRPPSFDGGERRDNYHETVKVPDVLKPPRVQSEAPRTQGEFDRRSKAPVTRQYTDTRPADPRTVPDANTKFSAAGDIRPKQQSVAPAAPKMPKAPMVASKGGFVTTIDKADSADYMFRKLTEKLRRRAHGSGTRDARRAQRLAFGKGGEAALPRPKTEWATPRENMSRMPYGSRKKHKEGFIARRKMGIKDLGTVTVSAETKKATMGNSLRVMSISDYYDVVMKADGPPAPGGAPGTGAPKRFPRKEKPTVKMKPISDQEAMANMKAGKFHEKSIVMLAAIKALVTGYGKVGGGALRAANRGTLTIHDLSRAMSVMPKPSGSLPPPTTYLPGVHGPEVKQRAAKIRAKASKKQVAKCDTESLVEKPDLKKQKNVVHKSEGAAPMAKMNYNDLFKSELGIANDEPLIDCPHCEAPITKSDIATANAKGRTMHGGDGRGQVKAPRGVPGAQKTDAVVVVQNGKGSKTRKSDVESVEGDAPVGETLKAVPAVKPEKPMQKSATFRGTEFVQYVDYGDAPGGDAYIAKSIAEAQGALGQQATQPMDLNNDLSRLLV